jgi:hypothetical protein
VKAEKTPKNETPTNGRAEERRREIEAKRLVQPFAARTNSSAFSFHLRSRHDP